ncbi:MAG: hypothetical protein DRO98_01465 [Archaeoglobales archaeon]|nr:MAG: hypothetical protein DRO98_01465 [Archaeoglobales archaeon]
MYFTDSATKLEPVVAYAWAINVTSDVAYTNGYGFILQASLPPQPQVVYAVVFFRSRT